MTFVTKADVYSLPSNTYNMPHNVYKLQLKLSLIVTNKSPIPTLSQEIRQTMENHLTNFNDVEVVWDTNFNDNTTVCWLQYTLSLNFISLGYNNSHKILYLKYQWDIEKQYDNL